MRNTGMFEGVAPRYAFTFPSITCEPYCTITVLSYVSTLCSRFVPTLSPNAVADRIISAMRCNEKIAVVPGYLRLLLIAKW